MELKKKHIEQLDVHRDFLLNLASGKRVGGMLPEKRRYLAAIYLDITGEKVGSCCNTWLRAMAKVYRDETSGK